MKKDNILISKKLKKLKSALLQVASKNILITFPGLTHLQTAQPISVGHFFMAYFEKNFHVSKDDTKILVKNCLEELQLL